MPVELEEIIFIFSTRGSYCFTHANAQQDLMASTSLILILMSCLCILLSKIIFDDFSSGDQFGTDPVI